MSSCNNNFINQYIIMPFQIQTMLREQVGLQALYLAHQIKFCLHNLLDHTNIQQLMEEWVTKETFVERLVVTH